MSNLHIASALRRMREKAGLKTNFVGEALGRQGKTVNAWEHGRGEPDIECLIRLQTLYKVDNIIAELSKKPLLPSRPETLKIPVSVCRMSGFIGIPREEFYVSREFVTVPFSETAKNADFAVMIDGESYDPQFSPGDILLLSRTDTLEIGELGIFSISGRVFIKGYAHNRLISLCKDFPDIEIDGAPNILCLAKVILKI
ncbi:MAG: helix-turn-helix domain-containing protein [Ruminococcus sp.]|jgi:transcriptional regulator with XRE-family HTH domain|nr:helix-turn-helix domain-containing protein [Ruminococcus sp.]